MITESSLLVKKRTLKKVHVRFLRKRQEDEDYEVDADTKLLSTEGKAFRIGTSTVMEEKNRKLHVGPDYQNSIFKISDILVENGPLNKIVSVKLQATGLQYISWEYAAKRLRSYGDLGLATWADKIDNFYKSFDRVVNEFDTKFKESRMSSENFWNQYQIEAQKACKRIESKFDKFYKFDYFLSKNVVHESSYSEGLYKALGYTDEESFISDIQKNGLPGVFDGDSAIYLNCVKHLLTLEGFFGNLIYQFPEERPYMKFRDGSRSRVTAHAFYIFEPTSIGFISHYYYVITKIGTTSDDDSSSDEFHSMFAKCHKGINGLTIS